MRGQGRTGARVDQAEVGRQRPSATEAADVSDRGQNGRGGWTIRLWDLADGRPRGAPLRGHAGAAAALALTDSTLVSAGAQDGTLRRWDVASGRQLSDRSGSAA